MDAAIDDFIQRYPKTLAYLREQEMRFSYNDVHGELTTLPGCSQVVVSHSVYARTIGNHQAVGANVARQRAAFDNGYDYMICTVDLNNKIQLHILNKCGWKQLDIFKSNKTGHIVGIFGKRLG